ncbi:methyltransferase domain-containing protein [Streptomyces sp. CBMA152]|uniref:methyltransferase domain-containing protein n=1 Tax=Streptomyces sp. CBMA152 TaxID=1896312 RepID=UPI0016606170|nr:methyltransferase domain-containing protein [Streptomyces sp. CBMA152]MBD0741876.1 hypothetical protein [Streptomyces sp. CBMA152]
MTTETTSEYLMDSADPDERARLRAIEDAYDPGTLRHLAALGVREGSRVLVAGVGAGSFLPWLSEAVGATGSVLATDIDTRHAAPVADQYENVEVRHHDFLSEDFPGGQFDVVHGRLILIHFPQRDEIIARLAAALKPGGTLLVEDYDWGSCGPAFPSADATAAEELSAKLAPYYREHGFDPYVGRKLPGLLRRAGLVDVDAEGRVLTLRGASSTLAPIYTKSHEQLVARPDARGLISEEETAAFLRRMADLEFDMTGQTMMAAWGRRAGAEAGA